MQAVFSLFYAGNSDYFSNLLQYDVAIDLGEHFQKQTFRNRCVIATSNGLQTLIVPVVREHKKTPMNEVKINYAEKWQLIHWRAITSAYKNSPYFEHYEHHFEDVYKNQAEHLWQFNKTILEKVLHILKINKEISFSKEYINSAEIDFRNHFTKDYLPKYTKPYQQVFNDRFDFQANLSIFDLIFNLGTESKTYLTELTKKND
ncbi:MAG: WbqC family protein [Bacteroidia bacterium]